MKISNTRINIAANILIHTNMNRNFMKFVQIRIKYMANINRFLGKNVCICETDRNRNMTQIDISMETH
jgi:hypothetical protein